MVVFMVMVVFTVLAINKDKFTVKLSDNKKINRHILLQIKTLYMKSSMMQTEY
jgi:hypothetical protein